MLLIVVVFSAWFPNAHGQSLARLYGLQPTGGAQWGPWAPWALCNTSPTACGTGTHVRHRQCQGVGCVPEIRGWQQIATFENGNCVKPCEADNGGRGAYYNGNWGEWSKWACTEPCQPGVQATRERYCDNPSPTPGHHCVGDDNGEQRQEEPAACEDYCAKEWTDWSSWSVCSMTCNAPVRKRIRDCLGIGAPCPGDAEETKNCDQDWRHDPCPAQHGEWGNWGAWSPDCYPQCLTGTRTRHRDCDNPPPVGDGEFCQGVDEDTKQCDIDEYMMTVCKAQAEWTKWSGWQECTATCGRATGFRTRQCKNPDGTLGNTCRGADKQEAQCSLPPCSALVFQEEEQGKIEALEKLREQEKNKIHHNIIVETVVEAKLPCRHDKGQLATEKATWKKDGKSLEVDGKHLVLDKWDLTIKSSRVNDTGIYVCRRGEKGDPDHAPIIYAVTVIPDKGKGVQTEKVGTEIKLPCNSGVLAIMIKGATAEWTRDKKIVKKMENLRTPSFVMDKPSVEDSGVYICNVKDPETKKHYTTNRVELKVLTANMMDKAFAKALDIRSKNPAVLFGALGGVGGFIVLVGIVCLILKKLQANELKDEPQLSSDEEEKIGMLGSDEGEDGPVDEDKEDVLGEGETKAAPEEETGSGSDKEKQGSDTDQNVEEKGGSDDDDDDGGGDHGGSADEGDDDKGSDDEGDDGGSGDEDDDGGSDEESDDGGNNNDTGTGTEDWPFYTSSR
ncbi:uncharacterized protein [Branchiostoma lanceolatum]|uniref:uncharacterized protein isoform X2 n=1 Tax=Branchiostoma lanceolatum TaxID=7740 RepID=UPI00345535D8